MSGHTPGPWRIRKKNADAEWVVDGTGGDGWYEFAKVCAFTIDTKGHRGNEAEGTANARLIACAPDLLRLLIAAVEGPWERYHLDEARAAIAKAKGEDA